MKIILKNATLNLQRAKEDFGRELWSKDNTQQGGSYWPNGVLNTDSYVQQYYYTGPINVYAGGTYRLQVINHATYSVQVCFYNSQGTCLDGFEFDANVDQSTFTIPSGTVYLKFSYYGSIHGQAYSLDIDDVTSLQRVS